MQNGKKPEDVSTIDAYGSQIISNQEPEIIIILTVWKKNPRCLSPK